jgi:homoserine kinase
VSGALAVTVPASSANLGAGFDVLGMGLDLRLEAGTGAAPDGARSVDVHHPAAIAFDALGGSGTIWLRSPIPMGRGLGFSGAARVAGASLAAAQRSPEDPQGAIAAARDEILAVTSALEGHGDNVAASVCGGVVAWVAGRALELRVGPQLASASVIAWVPDVTTATDRSRAELGTDVARTDVVHSLGRLAQFVVAVEHDDPALLVGATDDRLHQPSRLPLVPGAAAAIHAGVGAGAWCGWLSGSGPTVALLCPSRSAASVVAALPSGGRSKVLHIADRGVEVTAPPPH